LRYYERQAVKKSERKNARKAAASSEDEEVWRHTAATLEPLTRGKPRVRLGATPDAGGITRATVETARHARTEPENAPTHKIHPAHQKHALQTENRPPKLAEFDPRSARKIRIGRIEIEARVDLHGMRQDEAHAALRTFLFRCHSRGMRFVLVITGKGKPLTLSESSFSAREVERGVLRRNVPRWLEEPDLRSIVVGFTTAAIQHGGEGAIYVHLRKRPAEKR
jgi:DNA-nicking Smr family endonuclease